MPQAIDDYAGISTASWASGVTGHPTLNSTCLYFHWTTPDQQTVAVWNVMQPIRWTIHAPPENGGRFDMFDDHENGLFGFDILTSGLVGIRDRFMPEGWHCRFSDDQVRLSAVNFPAPMRCSSQGNAFDYDEAALEAIAPGVTPYDYDGSSKQFPVFVGIYAVQVRRNGRPIGALAVADSPVWPSTVSEQLVTIRPQDQLSLDVWYSVGMPARPLNDPGERKGCVYIPLAKVSNESLGAVSSEWHRMEFANVDFSPDFNHEEQTFAFSVSGHRGWRLLSNGSNGPHIGEFDENVPAELYQSDGSSGVIILRPAPPNSIPFSFFSLQFDREIAQVTAVLLDSTDNPLGARAFLYRSIDDAHLYLSQTTNTDFGQMRHAPAGRFNQSGTTVFELVPWSMVGNRFSDDPLNFNPDAARSEATNIDDPEIPAWVPRRITVTRVQRTDRE